MFDCLAEAENKVEMVNVCSYLELNMVSLEDDSMKNPGWFLANLGGYYG